jgi:hypothetical protein
MWGFSPPLARQVVRGHTWKELTSAWRLSCKRLTSAQSPGRTLALVTLRAAVLDEMEAQDPAAFAAWLARQHPKRGG